MRNALVPHRDKNAQHRTSTANQFFINVLRKLPDILLRRDKVDGGVERERTPRIRSWSLAPRDFPTAPRRWTELWLPPRHSQPARASAEIHFAQHATVTHFATLIASNHRDGGPLRRARKEGRRCATSFQRDMMCASRPYD